MEEKRQAMKYVQALENGSHVIIETVIPKGKEGFFLVRLKDFRLLPLMVKEIVATSDNGDEYKFVTR